MLKLCIVKHKEIDSEKMHSNLFLSFAFLQELLHCIHCLLEPFAFVNFDHLLLVWMVGFQLFQLYPSTKNNKSTMN